MSKKFFLFNTYSCFFSLNKVSTFTKKIVAYFSSSTDWSELMSKYFPRTSDYLRILWIPFSISVRNVQNGFLVNFQVPPVVLCLEVAGRRSLHDRVSSGRDRQHRCSRQTSSEEFWRAIEEMGPGNYYAYFSHVARFIEIGVFLLVWRCLK